MEQVIEKMFSPSEIIASELAVLKCVYLEENICHGQSIYEETVLITCISLREDFGNSIAFTVMNKSGKGGVDQISTVFGPPYFVSCRRVL